MYYFLFVCVAFFIRSFIIRDIYMKTAFFSALAAHSSIAAVLPQPEISASPCNGAAPLHPRWLRDTQMMEIYPQVRQLLHPPAPERDVQLIACSPLPLSHLVSQLGCSAHLVSSSAWLLFVLFQQKEASVESLSRGGILSGFPKVALAAEL